MQVNQVVNTNEVLFLAKLGAIAIDNQVQNRLACAIKNK
jgi:hypothetical protein